MPHLKVLILSYFLNTVLAKTNKSTCLYLLMMMMIRRREGELKGERKGEKKRRKGRHAREVRIGVLLLALLPTYSELQKSLDVSGPSFLFNKMNRCETSGEHEGSPPHSKLVPAHPSHLCSNLKISLGRGDLKFTQFAGVGELVYNNDNTKL